MHSPRNTHANIDQHEPGSVELSKREQLWEIVDGIAQNEQERVLLIESFVYGLPPRAILARYPQLFASDVDIYSAKRNLLERLMHCQELREIYRGLAPT
jgi:hypothetical protein